MKPLLVVTTGQHIRLARVMQYALQGLPYERVDLGAGGNPFAPGQAGPFCPFPWASMAWMPKSAA